MPASFRATAAALALAACAPHAAAQSAPRPADSAYVARARADSVRRPYTEADARFMRDMIGHHAQAIVMSRLAPTHGASPAVRTLADRIVNAQQDEIALVQQWLRDRGKPVPDPSLRSGQRQGHDVPGMEDMHHELMPGMLTDAQMRELDAARDSTFDRLFLTYMIRHHNGAIAMVKDLFAHPGAGQDETVFKFANDVNVDQSTEVARMRRMLAQLLFGK